MVCKPKRKPRAKRFFCQKCKKMISYSRRDRQSAIRNHYWTHHKKAMMQNR